MYIFITDLQYSDSGSSGLEEVEQKDAAEAMVQLSVRPGQFIIKYFIIIIAVT